MTELYTTCKWSPPVSEVSLLRGFDHSFTEGVTLQFNKQGFVWPERSVLAKNTACGLAWRCKKNKYLYSLPILQGQHHFSSDHFNPQWLFLSFLWQKSQCFPNLTGNTNWLGWWLKLQISGHHPMPMKSESQEEAMGICVWISILGDSSHQATLS